MCRQTGRSACPVLCLGTLRSSVRLTGAFWTRFASVSLYDCRRGSFKGAHIDRLVDVMGNQEHRGEAGLPEAKYFILHSNACKGIESSERFLKALFPKA